MTTATAQDYARWLRPIAAAVRNPPSADDYKARCAAAAFALRYPATDLTDNAARDLARSSPFWPSVADIDAALSTAWKARITSNQHAALLAAPTREAAPYTPPAGAVECFRARQRPRTTPTQDPNA
jgi:hypothetical protein